MYIWLSFGLFGWLVGSLDFSWSSRVNISIKVLFSNFEILLVLLLNAFAEYFNLNLFHSLAAKCAFFSLSFNYLHIFTQSSSPAPHEVNVVWYSHARSCFSFWDQKSSGLWCTCTIHIVVFRGMRVVRLTFSLIRLHITSAHRTTSYLCAVWPDECTQRSTISLHIRQRRMLDNWICFWFRAFHFHWNATLFVVALRWHTFRSTWSFFTLHGMRVWWCDWFFWWLQLAKLWTCTANEMGFWFDLRAFCKPSCRVRIENLAIACIVRHAACVCRIHSLRMMISGIRNSSYAYSLWPMQLHVRVNNGNQCKWCNGQRSCPFRFLSNLKWICRNQNFRFSLFIGHRCSCWFRGN